MLDIGWSELAVVAVLALLVIGPKDLPGVMRTMGKWMQKARSVSREFQSSVDEMMRETELDDARKALDSAKNFNVERSMENTLDPDGEVKKSAREIDREARREDSDSGKKVADATGKKAADAGAPENKTPESKAAENKPDAEAPKATKVETPANIAPPHSVMPPAEPASKPDTGQAKPASEPKAAPKPQAAPKPKAAAKPRAAPKPKAAAKPGSAKSGNEQKTASGSGGT